MLKPSFYYLLKNAINGNWVIHQAGCVNLPADVNRIFLGSLYTKGQAVTVAKIHHPDATQCPLCLNNFNHARKKPAFGLTNCPTPIRHLPGQY